MPKKNPLEAPYMKKKEAKSRLEKQKEEAEKNFEQAERGWEDVGEELEFEESLRERVKKGQKDEIGKQLDEQQKQKEQEERELKEFFKGEEVEEAYELKNKKERSLEMNIDKLTLSELDDRVHALWGAMDGVLQDAADYQLTKGEKKKIKHWAKNKGKVEDWPLDDSVTADNYEERLEKYGIAQFIDPSKIKKHKDAYAVIAEQYKIYRDALEQRIRKAKLRQLEQLESGDFPKQNEKEKAEKVFELKNEKEKPKPAPAPEAGKEKLEKMEEHLENEDIEESKEEATKLLKKYEEEKIPTAIIKRPKKQKKEKKKKQSIWSRVFGGLFKKKKKVKIKKENGKEIIDLPKSHYMSTKK